MMMCKGDTQLHLFLSGKLCVHMPVLGHSGLLEADEDKIWKIRPKGTLFRILEAYRILNRVPAGCIFSKGRDLRRELCDNLSSSAYSRPI